MDNKKVKILNKLQHTRLRYVEDLLTSCRLKSIHNDNFEIAMWFMFYNHSIKFLQKCESETKKEDCEDLFLLMLELLDELDDETFNELFYQLLNDYTKMVKENTGDCSYEFWESWLEKHLDKLMG